MLSGIYTAIAPKESRKGAGKLDFWNDICNAIATLLLRGCSLHTDNVSRERQALSAFGLAAEACIDFTGTVTFAPRRGTQVFFSYGIADTDYHRFAC